MQSLLQSLQDYDAGHLRVIAELWGLELAPAPALQMAKALAPQMLEAGALVEIVESLSPQAEQALTLLMRQGGRFSLQDMTRRFGRMRMMGAGRRDREKPWRTESSAMEALWYRGLIAFAFADTPTGPQEFAFIPTDLLALLPEPSPAGQASFGGEAEVPPVQRPASLAAVEDSVTLLAALRRRPSMPLPELHQRLHPFLLQPASLDLLISLLQEIGLLAPPQLKPDPEATRVLLDQPTDQIAARLLQAWQTCVAWNDLAHVPTLALRGDTWPNNPLTARATILAFLEPIPRGVWWDLESFIRDVYDQQPSFQRPGGDFDSWYLQHAETGAFLRGYEHWEAVEGALLRYLFTGPLHWLGAVDLGASSDHLPPHFFRLTDLSAALFKAEPLAVAVQTQETTFVRPDGRISVPRSARLDLRYQISRFCTWLRLDEEGYKFRITPAALQAAQEQGLQLEHIVTVLRAALEGEVPPTLLRALERWSQQGVEARLERHLVLRVKEAATLEALKQDAQVARYLLGTLGPKTAVVKERDWEALISAAARHGILVDLPETSQGGVT